MKKWVSKNASKNRRNSQELESGELDLDKSIGKYERAVVLRDRCKKILEESERRVRKITETPEGTEISDFSAD